MMSNPDAIFEAAMGLPERDRLVLVTRLMDTLPPDDSGLSMDDPGLVDELDRRWAENDKGISWAELRDQT